QGQPEASHAGVGDRDFAGPALLEEDRDHASSTAQHVSVADAAEARRAWTSVDIALHEQLFSAQLGGPVEVDRIDSLVGAERDHLWHATIDSGLDDVLGSQHIGLDGFEGVVLACGDLLEGGSMYHDIHGCLERSVQAIAVAHVAHEKAEARIGELNTHL